MAIRSESGVVQVGSNAYALIQENALTNAGFLVGEEGVIVIDSLMTPTLARRLQWEVRRITPAPIRFLINTHFHGDHTFGNQFFKPAPIISHVNARIELREAGQRYVQQFAQRGPEMARELEQVTITLPDTTFQDRMTLHLGGSVVELAYLGLGHTKGDIVVHLPGEKVLFAGDLAFHRCYPASHSAHITSWVEALKRLEGMDLDTVIPGHGPIGDREELASVREYFTLLKEEVARRLHSGVPADQAAQEIKLSGYSSWLNPDRLAPAVHRLYAELQGTP